MYKVFSQAEPDPITLMIILQKAEFWWYRLYAGKSPKY